MVQDIIVYLIVAAAALYLARLWWLSARNKRSCGCGTGAGCPKLSSTQPVKPLNNGLIQIDLSGGRKIIAEQRSSQSASDQ